MLPTSDPRRTFRAQLGFGGDELVSVEYSDGSESGLDLGKYMSISVGPVYELWSFGPSSLELQAMIGWAGWSTGPQNTDDRLKLSHFPVDLPAFYGLRIPASNRMFRIGGGATYHLGMKVRGTGSLDDYRRDFSSSLGYTGEVSMIRDSFTAGVRYTRMDVTMDGVPVPFDGSSLGLFVGITTPRK